MGEGEGGTEKGGAAIGLKGACCEDAAGFRAGSQSTNGRGMPMDKTHRALSCRITRMQSYVVETLSTTAE